MQTAVAQRSRFTRETLPEDFAAKERDIIMIRQARKTAPPPTPLPPPGFDPLEVATLFALVVALLVLAWCTS